MHDLSVQLSDDAVPDMLRHASSIALQEPSLTLLVVRFTVVCPWTRPDARTCTNTLYPRRQRPCSILLDRLHDTSAETEKLNLVPGRTCHAFKTSLRHHDASIDLGRTSRGDWLRECAWREFLRGAGRQHGTTLTCFTAPRPTFARSLLSTVAP